MVTRTGMFHGSFERTYSWFHRLIMPMLTDQQVSDATIYAIENGYEVMIGRLAIRLLFAVLELRDGLKLSRV